MVAVLRRSSPLLVLAEQELRLHGRRAGHRGGETQPGRRSAEVLSRRRPSRAERQPEGDARQRPAPHVHGAAKRAAADAQAALDQDLPRAARPLQARHPFPLQHFRDLHALGHRAEGDGHDRSGLSPAALLRAAGHRRPDLGNQSARHLGRRVRLEHPHRGHRASASFTCKRASGRENNSFPKRGSRRPPPGRLPTAATPRAIGTRATVTSSGAAGTARTGATGRLGSTASCCPSRTRCSSSPAASRTCRPS